MVLPITNHQCRVSLFYVKIFALRLRTLKSLSFFILPVFLLAGISGCGLWKDPGKFDSATDPEIDSAISTNIPFSTKEPENFQAEIIISSFIKEQKSEQRYLIARQNGNSLQTSYKGSEKERSILRTAENKTYLINHQTRSYRELTSGRGSAFSDDKLIKSLTSKWLNEKTSAKFEKAGTEKELTKYLVKFDDSTKTEVFIYVDEKLKIPVKQEFFSLYENKKTLTYRMEIKNFKSKANEELFKLPEGFEEVTGS